MASINSHESLNSKVDIELVPTPPAAHEDPLTSELEDEILLSWYVTCDEVTTEAQRSLVRNNGIHAAML